MGDFLSGTDGQGTNEPPFVVHGDSAPTRPIVLSVCHAGRHYPRDLAAQLRVPSTALRRLEDRHADGLIAPLVAQGASAIVAHAPRALIDLNRDERDIDPAMIADLPRDASLMTSAKQRGGLGLFPNSLPGVGPLWGGRLSWQEAQRRTGQIHRPYHARLAQMLDTAQGVHGNVLLLDVHSMPPLKAGRTGDRVPDIVIGDRFGASAGSRLSAVAMAVAGGWGFEAALNHPYPGSYVLERHGRPEKGRHALQIEISRALYLDDAHDQPADGMRSVQDMLCALVSALETELGSGRMLEAAE
jgi:N-formylglutamate amidohydrolase